jgi:hypothetical protein
MERRRWLQLDGCVLARTPNIRKIVETDSYFVRTAKLISS